MIKTNKSKGFTLVEIMIVVAIIALLAAIAVPGFLRARVRGQATTVLNDARILDAAVQQYMIEQNRAPGNAPTGFSNYTGYLKANSKLVQSSGQDIFGKAFAINASGAVTIEASTKTNLQKDGIVDTNFWAGY